ncbi:MAG TPA: type II secretion system F family protein [Alphaproteobacteria bacterium]|nr:type II secretion system F family protein [Alphaproteobacteria bacterium]
MSFDFAPFGLGPDAVVLAMAGISAMVAVIAVWNALVVRDPLGTRLKALAERRAALKAGLTAPNRRKERQKASVGLMKQVVNRFKLMKNRPSTSLPMKLARGGFRSKDAPIVYTFCRVAMPVVFGALAAVVLFVLELYRLSDQAKLGITVGAVVLGFVAPDVFLRNAITKRQKALRKQLPDGLDLLVICAEAGLGLDAAFSRVSKEMVKSSPELADEVGLTSIELSFLPERRQALQNLIDRTNMPEIRAVVNTLMQTEKYGTPLAQSLRVLSAEFRNERLLRAEEKAARLPAILTVPMIIFILPALFIVLIGPAILRAIDALGSL